ncbi:MAG: PorT family protein [Flavobacteriales bacterium]|nr:PorT family protein [Flavobacteriales bacterium]
MLKRTCTLSLLVIAAISTTKAQDDSFRLGIKLAPNFAWMRSDSKDLQSDGNRLSYSFGLTGDLKLNAAGNYFFSTGILYNNIGGTFKADGTYDLNGTTTTVRSQQDLKLRYIEVPLTLKLRATSEKPLSFYGQVGFSAAFNIRARTDATTTLTVGNNTSSASLDDENVIDDIALFKASMVVGAGLEFALPSGTTLFGGLTYNNAFTNALDGDAKNLNATGKKSRLYADYLEITLGIFL